MTVTDHEQALLDANQTAQLAIENAKADGVTEGLTQGVTQVTSYPSSYNLMTVTDHEQALLDANQTAEQAIQDAKAEGITEGINEVLSNPTEHGLTQIEVLESSGATPHTNGWFFQPDWGWLWTNASVFPYVYRSEQQDTSSSWLYFKENSSPPYFFNYETEEWEVMGE